MRRPCYIFDIDGTLADGEHRMHHIKKTPKDWDAFFADVGGDKPIAHVIAIAWALYSHGHNIVYVSGRSSVCRHETQQWLDLHNNLPRGLLFMRREGDHRPDDIVKIEILNIIRANDLEPVMAFDDRDRVVKAWRAAGVPCAQVAEGNF